MGWASVGASYRLRTMFGLLMLEETKPGLVSRGLTCRLDRYPSRMALSTLLGESTEPFYFD